MVLLSRAKAQASQVVHSRLLVKAVAAQKPPSRAAWASPRYMGLFVHVNVFDGVPVIVGFAGLSSHLSGV